MDRIDRQIVHCLQHDGRAPFSLIGQVVGVSEQTVARRYRALLDQGALRVLVLPDAAAAGQRSWFIRIQCRPAAADTLAEAIAARDDVSWVSVTSGGGELVCATRTDRGEANGSVLRRLPKTSQVLSFMAYSVLHMYVGGEAEWMALPDPLSREQRSCLQAQSRTVRTAPVAGTRTMVRSDDVPLLAALGADGRASVATLSRRTGWPHTRVSGRLAELLSTGAAYVDLDFAPQVFGYDAIAYLLLTVAPGELAATGLALSRHPETSFAAAITGAANLITAVTCRDTDDLYTYVTTKVGALASVRQAEIVPTLRRVKQAGTLVRDGRLVSPERDVLKN